MQSINQWVCTVRACFKRLAPVQNDGSRGHLHIVDVELIVVSRDSQKNAQTSPDFSNLDAVN